MANTPFDDLGTEEILSTRISGIQDAVKNIEQSLNMDTEAVSEESLTLLADAMGRYRIAEAVGKRNWLDDPAPVIEQYIGGTWTQISTGFTIDYAGGAIIFTEDKVGEQFRASFTRVKNTSGHNAHSAQHEDGGDDEISLEDLSGESAALKTHLSDKAPHVVPAARVYNDANISSVNSDFTILSFNSERYDTDNIHDTITNNSRLTAKTAGVYRIHGQIAFATNGTGRRQVLIKLNRSPDIAFIGFEALSNAPTRVGISTSYYLNVNDFVELLVWQDSGGALDIVANGNYSPEFMMERVG